jgi:hypothetical protein
VELVRAHGPVRLRSALGTLEQVAQVVAYLHGHGHMHGCLVPDMIFVDPNGHCTVAWSGGPLDVRDESLPADWLRRTRPFLAPEVLEARAADTRADVYSLGVLLHWLLTRSGPEKSGPSSKIPRRIAAPIERATRSAPADRYQTVSAFMDALAAIPDHEIRHLEHELDLATRAAGFDPRLLWRRRPRTLIAVAVAVLALLALGTWRVQKHYSAIRRQQDELEARFVRELERRRVLADQHAAEQLFQDGQFPDAVTLYKRLATQNTIPGMAEPALRRIAQAYRELKDYGSEYTAWMRLLRQFPETEFAGEANERIVRIAALTVTRYGDLRDIATDREILVDGIPDDWDGIEPLVVDPKGDQRRGGEDSDLVAFYAVVRDGTFYARFDTAAPPRLGDQFCIAFILNVFAYEDSSQSWDYQLGVARGIAPWIWDLREERDYANSESAALHGVIFAQNQCVEFSFPLAAIGSPTSAGIRVFTNYPRLNGPNDVAPRKILAKWGPPKLVAPPPRATLAPGAAEGASPSEPAERRPGARRWPRRRPPKGDGTPSRERAPRPGPGAGSLEHVPPLDEAEGGEEQEPEPPPRRPYPLR